MKIGIDVFEMLNRFGRIMVHDFKKGNGTFRILWKSAARWKRLGWDGMLEWLDKEIWKIPNPKSVLEIDTRAYQRWIREVESTLFEDTIQVDSGIKFSVFVSKDFENKAIAETIASLQKQLYTNWELIWIDEWNEALTKASGKWGLILDPMVVLNPHALGEFSKMISFCGDVALIYSDHDAIDAKGFRSNPHFKSDFNLDMLYSFPYTGKAFVWDIQTLRQIGGFEAIHRECWEYDLILRIWEAKGERCIRHVQKVLFHITGHSVEELSCYKQSLQTHFKRLNQEVSIEPGIVTQTFRIRWKLPEAMPKVSIIIPTRDHLDVLEQCIESIINKTAYSLYEIVIADNQSQEAATLEYFKRIGSRKNVRILKYDHPFNYSAINNFAVGEAEGEIIVFLNNDIEVISPEWLDELVMHTLKPDIGCVGAMLYYPDDTIQHAGVICGMGDVAGHAHKYMKRGSRGYFNRACITQNISAVTGACLAVRKSVFEEVGGFNEADLTVAYNDVDLCLKVLHAGYRNVWTPYAELYHYESKSRGKDNTPQKKARYVKEVEYMHVHWKDTILHDPYYHPMFTKTAEQFQLRRMKQ